MNQPPKQNNLNTTNIKAAPDNKLQQPKPDMGFPVPKNNKPKNIPTTPTMETSTVSNVSSSNENTQPKNNKNMPPKKPSLFSRIKNKTKSGYRQFKTDLKSPITEIIDIDTSGMVPVSDYRDELLAKEAARQAGEIPKDFESSNEFELPAIELDEYLRGRYAIKAEEFKRLQQEQGFYFSDTLDSQILERARLNEGMFLVGVNLNSLIDLYRQIVFKEPLLDADGNPIEIPGEGDILDSGRAEDLVGESYSVDYDKIYRDKMGFRLGPHRQLRPELVLRDNTPFDDIVRESAKYTGSSYQRISPKSLLNMIRILDEYSKYELQWLRSATAIEIIYKYMSNGMSREVFFNSESRLTEESLLELEEFFKTDNLFMTLDEIREFKNDLNFYRSEKNRKLIDNKEKKKRAAMNEKKSNTTKPIV